MSKTSVKVAIALFMVLATPAASFARGGRGGGGAAMGGSRPNAALGSQIGAASMLANPSRVGNAPGVAAPPPPRLSAPTIPQFK
jgi:hypothetical protein